MNQPRRYEYVPNVNYLSKIDISFLQQIPNADPKRWNGVRFVCEFLNEFGLE